MTMGQKNDTTAPMMIAQMYAWVSSPTSQNVPSPLMKNDSSRNVTSRSDADPKEPLQHP